MAKTVQDDEVKPKNQAGIGILWKLCICSLGPLMVMCAVAKLSIILIPRIYAMTQSI